MQISRHTSRLREDFHLLLRCFGILFLWQRKIREKPLSLRAPASNVTILFHTCSFGTLENPFRKNPVLHTTIVLVFWEFTRDFHEKSFLCPIFFFSSVVSTHKIYRVDYRVSSVKLNCFELEKYARNEIFLNELLSLFRVDPVSILYFHRTRFSLELAKVSGKGKFLFEHKKKVNYLPRQNFGSIYTRVNEIPGYLELRFEAHILKPGFLTSSEFPEFLSLSEAKVAHGYTGWLQFFEASPHLVPENQ